jgi:hypothetical protein
MLDRPRNVCVKGAVVPNRDRFTGTERPSAQSLSRGWLRPFALVAALTSVLAVGGGGKSDSTSSSPATSGPTTVAGGVGTGADAASTTVVIAPADQAYCAQVLPSRQAINRIEVDVDPAAALALLRQGYENYTTNAPPEIAAEASRLHDRIVAASSMAELEETTNDPAGMEADGQKFENWHDAHCGTVG